MATSTVQIIVTGFLNVDILALGFAQLGGDSGIGFGDEIRVSPGGKGRNMAVLAAMFLGPNRVAMLGKTSIDPLFGPIVLDSLINAGVNVDYVSSIEFSVSGKYPGIAIIPVDREGRHQIYAVPGINDDFCASDIDTAGPLFEAAAANNGLVLVTLEHKLDVVRRIVATAKQYQLRVVLDPGGMSPQERYDDVLEAGLYFIKPNRAEAQRLTGIEVRDRHSAATAAEELRRRGIDNVLITLGADGAFLLTNSGAEHIQVPALPTTEIKDETGCGDQAAAALCARLLSGDDLREAAYCAVAAATLQFGKAGVEPVTARELSSIPYQTRLGKEG